MNFLIKKKKSQILPPGADHGHKITVARLLGERFLEKIQKGLMVDENLNSTYLSVLGEEGQTTILLAHQIFGFN